MASKKKSADLEQIGFHKGSLATLSKERAELLRILGIVEQLMQMHANTLKDMGIDLETEAAQMVAETKGEASTKPRQKPPIEDII